MLLEGTCDPAKANLKSSYSPSMTSCDDQIRNAQTKVSARRWQFFARAWQMLWVVVDTVMSAMGKNLPGRRRSLDPAIRSVATETGQQANAKAALEYLLQQKQQLEQQHQQELSVRNKPHPGWVDVDPLELKPQKGDIEADEVSLVWLPFRISPAGAAEPCFHWPKVRHHVFGWLAHSPRSAAPSLRVAAKRGYH